MSWPKLHLAAARCGVAVSALAVLLPALLAVPLASATPAYAAPTHVAIVIAGDKSVCVPWKSGMTGDSLLHEVASVTYNSSHMINRIDGSPADGAASTSAYWAYWHNTGGGWTYSSVGASDYSVPAGSVEGWIFGDGSAPPGGSYASICAGQDPATQAAPSAAAANPQTTSAQRASGTAPVATAVGPSAGSAGSAGSAAGSSSPGSAPAGTPHSSAPRAPAKSAARSAGRTAAHPTVTASTPTTSTTTVQTDAAALAKPAAHRSANSALGAAVAGLSVLALAAGAFWARRRRGSV